MPSYALDIVAADKQKEFLKLLPDSVTTQHKKIASLGFDQAFKAVSYVEFDLNGLNIISDNKSDQFITIKNVQMSGQKIAFRLPNIEGEVLLEVDSVQNNINGINMVTYSGIVGKDKSSHFILTVSDKEGVVGKISYGQFLYIISPIGDARGLHTIVKLEKALIPKIPDDMKGEDKKNTLANTVPIDTKNNKHIYNYGHVSILFYVTEDVASPNSLVSGIISEMSTAFFNSGIYFHSVFNAPGSPIELDTTFPNQCKDTIIKKLRNQTDEFANIDQDMLVHGADIAFLIVGDTSDGTSNCFSGHPGRVGGIAAWIYDSSKASAMSARAYVLGDLTALHEIGHVMGGKHSNQVYTTAYGANNSPESVRGYTDPNDNWQTIMGGYSECPFDNGIYSSCERLLRFSNPSTLYNYQGQPSGVSISNNVSLWLNNSMYTMSQWRSSPLVIPSSPNPISTQSEYCYGLNTVNWTAKNGAISYKLYKSTSANFYNPMLIYSGANTSAFVNVNYGTWYLRAQACNAAGCSVNSTQVLAERYNGCL